MPEELPDQTTRFNSLEVMVIALAGVAFWLIPNHTGVAVVLFLFAVGVACLERML